MRSFSLLCVVLSFLLVSVAAIRPDQSSILQEPDENGVTGDRPAEEIAAPSEPIAFFPRTNVNVGALQPMQAPVQAPAPAAAAAAPLDVFAAPSESSVRAPAADDSPVPTAADVVPEGPVEAVDVTVRTPAEAAAGAAEPITVGATTCASGGRSGMCIATTSACAGTWQSNLCPGTSRCCLAPAPAAPVACSYGNRAGSCIATTSACAGTWQSNLCPGTSRCCLAAAPVAPTPTTPTTPATPTGLRNCTDGTRTGHCQSLSVNCAGAFQSNLCPGLASTIRCCLKPIPTDITPPPPGARFTLNAALLASAVGCTLTTATTFLPHVIETTNKYSITTRRRMAHFLAQVSHETDGFRIKEEAMGYSAARMMDVWPTRFPTLKSAQPYAYNPEKLGNYVYANRMDNGGPETGDGYKYRGRGAIQCTGRYSYTKLAEATGIDCVRNPDLLLQPQYSLLSAGWEWNKGNLNKWADENNLLKITLIINGGTVGLQDRRDRYARAARVLGA